MLSSTSCECRTNIWHGRGIGRPDNVRLLTRNLGQTRVSQDGEPIRHADSGEFLPTARCETGRSVDVTAMKQFGMLELPIWVDSNGQRLGI